MSPTRSSPAANSRPAKISVGLRPQRSLSMPPSSGPAMQPNNALPMASPLASGLSPNSGFNIEHRSGDDRQIVAEQETAHGGHRGDQHDEKGPLAAFSMCSLCRCVPFASANVPFVSLSSHPAAVDQQHVAVHVIAGVACQEQQRADEVLGLSPTARRNPAANLRLAHGVVDQSPAHISVSK